MALEHLTEANFEERILKNPKLCVVDFSATWCGPCIMLGPIFEKVANEYADKVDFFKVDIDEAQNLAINLGIQAVPTIIFFKNGKEVKRQVGLIPEAMLKNIIDSLL